MFRSYRQAAELTLLSGISMEVDIPKELEPLPLHSDATGSISSPAGIGGAPALFKPEEPIVTWMSFFQIVMETVGVGR